jgi:hypothetical protein
MSEDQKSGVDSHNTWDGLRRQLPDLVQERRWIAWRRQQRRGKWTKVPYCPKNHRKRASSSDSSTWATFEEAVAAFENHSFDGIGVMFGPLENGKYLVGVDLDHCRDPDTGSILPEAQRIIASFSDPFWEASPSGTGLHVLGLCDDAPEKHSCRKKMKGFEVEAYSHGRYFTVSGETLNNNGVTDVTNPFNELVELIAATKKKTSKTKRTSKSKQKTSKAKKVSKPVSDDDAIIERVQRERPDLWKGDLSKYGDDHSRADLALCGTIARHCGFDPERIDRIFRKSPLYRDKWERDDYRETTIAKAVDELDGKPIEITGGQLPRMVDEAEDALIADIEYGGDYVFQRGSQLVRLVRSKVPKVRDGIRCPAGYLSALAVLKSYLIERLTRVAVWIKYDARSNEFFPQDCPEKVADVYLGRVGCWELPVLHAIVQAPTLRRDGSILQTPGLRRRDGYLL